LADELQLSVYNFEMADVEKTWKHFELCESECKALLEGYSQHVRDNSSVAKKRRFPLLAAYELCLRCSHLFNILDARGAISVTERVAVIARVRALAVGIAKAWVNQQATSAEPEEEDPGLAAEKKTIHLAPAAH
jgi:glycyl-tRNA synthetase alpha chain